VRALSAHAAGASPCLSDSVRCRTSRNMVTQAYSRCNRRMGNCPIEHCKCPNVCCVCFAASALHMDVTKFEIVTPCHSGHSQRCPENNSMQCDDPLPELNADDAANVADRLKARRRTSSKRTLQPAVPQLAARHRAHRPWKAVPIEASGSPQDIDQVITLLSEQMQNVRQLPQNSSYAKHRLRLLTTALRVAEGRR
jgi:hypothetical protein